MNKWLSIILVLVLIYLFGSIVAGLFFSEDSLGDKIVVVPLSGVIVSEDIDAGVFGKNIISSADVVKEIKALNKEDSVKGVIFLVNSPGGTAVASQEIAEAVKELKKPKYAVIREVGASGGYWIASAADKIYASPISITGSIGVLASYLEFSKLFEKYGVDYERLVGGEFKDIGSPFKDLKKEERELLQKKINLLHEFFIQEVAVNRNMSVEDLKKIATGEFYLGSEAKGLGLIDEFGDRDDALEAMKKELNIPDINVVEKKHKKGLLNVLLGDVAYNFGRGFGNVFVENELNNNFRIIA